MRYSKKIVGLVLSMAIISVIGASVALGKSDKSGLWDAIFDLQGRADVLQTRVDGHDSDITSLQSRIGTLETQVSTLETTIADQQTQITSLESQIQAYQNGLLNPPAYDSGWVLSDNQIVSLKHNLGTNRVLVFFFGSHDDTFEYITHNGYGYRYFEGLGGGWGSLSATDINVYGAVGFKYVHVMMWKIDEQG